MYKHFIEEKITINEQSSIRIDCEKTIYFDPYRIKTEAYDADIIFFTHPHVDHFSPNAYEKVVNEETIFVTPKSMEDKAVEAGICKDKLYLMKPEEEMNLQDVKIKAVYAYTPKRKTHLKEKNWLGYIVEVEGMKIYVCGDMEAAEENMDVACDVMMVPIGDKYTMNAKEAADFVNQIKPEIAIPIHYGTVVGTTSNGEVFKSFVDDNIEVMFKIKF